LLLLGRSQIFGKAFSTRASESKSHLGRSCFCFYGGSGGLRMLCRMTGTCLGIFDFPTSSMRLTNHCIDPVAAITTRIPGVGKLGINSRPTLLPPASESRSPLPRCGGCLQSPNTDGGACKHHVSYIRSRASFGRTCLKGDTEQFYPGPVARPASFFLWHQSFEITPVCKSVGEKGYSL